MTRTARHTGGPMPRITARERARAKQAGRPPRYTCSWTDADGVRRQDTTYTDKRLAARFEAAQREHARAVADGLVDTRALAARDHGAADITAHAEAFLAQLAAGAVGRRGKPGEKRLGEVRRYLSRFIAWTGPGHPAPARRLADVSVERAAAWVTDLEARGWVTPSGKRRRYSAVSINEFIGAVTMFSAWAHQTGRALTDPLASMTRRPRSYTEGRRTHRRRAMSVDQVAMIVHAAETRPLIAARTLNRGPRKGQPGARVSPQRERALVEQGFERGTFYLTSFWGALRRSEVGTLLWGDLVLGGHRPLIRLRGPDTKAKRDDVVALHPELAARLDTLRGTRDPAPDPHDRVFPTMPSRETFRKDLAAAGIDPCVGDLHFDLHAMRMSIQTYLASEGVGQRLAQAHMRHTDPRLTAITYTDAAALPVADAIGRLPALAAPAPRAGGTTGRYKARRGTHGARPGEPKKQRKGL